MVLKLVLLTLVTHVISACLAKTIAGQKARSSQKWFLAGLLFGPLGLIAARRLGDLRRSGLFLTTFAVLTPLVSAGLAIGASMLMRLSQGDALLFTVLCASASYIAVPAAVRVALPRANPSLYLPMPLAVTFPFNIALGIPLYYGIISALWS